jgi:hypothetical protein
MPAPAPVAPSPPPTATAPPLRFDGVYILRHPDKGYAEYLRFWADGRVVEASSKATAEQVATWLDGSYGTGRYTIDGDGTHIKFQDVSPSGVVDYEGTITPDGLTLDWASHINNQSGTGTV